MTAFFEFAEDRYWVGEPKLVAVGPAEVVRSVMTEEQLLKTFGAYVAYVDDYSGRSFLGVWHPPRIQHFYRELRDRGAPLDIVTERPARLRLRERLGA